MTRRPHVLISGASIAGPALVPRIANPRTRVGLAAFRLGLRVAAGRPVKRPGNRLFSPPADKIELPDYTHLETGASDRV